MPVTIRDVARKAGVSPITVSRTFSGTHPVAEDTRRKVLQAAEELGYTIDLLARALARKQSPIIGMIVPELANPFFVTIIDAVQAVARQKEHMVIVNQSERQPEMELSSLHQFRQLRMAGVLVTPASTTLDHLRSLQADGTPVVVVARCWEEGDCVTVDDFAGGRMAGEHLIRLGHRKIGGIAHAEPGNTAVQARVQGFRAVIEESGYALLPERMIHTATLRLSNAEQAANTFLALSDRPTAVFVTADRLAIGFIHQLRARGVRVPEDVAVVGYDDIHYAEFLQVPLTTVALPKYEMGQQAAQILFDRIENGYANGEEHRRILLGPRLIVRASCGAQSVSNQ
jgi:LacI family transcriptional regulator